MQRLRKDDEVIVISGKDKGQTGTIQKVLSNSKLLIGGINIVKKHLKPNPNLGVQGGIVDKEMPIHQSNVMILNSITGKGDRVGFKHLEDGKHVRYFKSNGEIID